MIRGELQGYPRKPLDDAFDESNLKIFIHCYFEAYFVEKRFLFPHRSCLLEVYIILDTCCIPTLKIHLPTI
jgi:hypothetical protein